MEKDILLHMKNISKIYPGVKALNDVELKVSRGKVHALMGENGAGKSTLIKVLTGVVAKDEGEVIFDGNKIEINCPTDANDNGISTVYQELDLIPELSICENIYLGREIKKRGFIDWKETEKRATEIMTSMGIDVNVKDILSSKSTAIQQMVSIARAISINAKLVVLDEPTSSLDASEVEILFNVIRDLKKRDIAVIFITHRLEEVFSMCDEMTILKDGELVATSDVKDITRLEMVSKMIGKDASSVVSYRKSYDESKIQDDSIIKGVNINSKPKVKNQNIDIKKGEILGLAGLLGSGRTELVRLIFGADLMTDGKLEINGKEQKINSPRDAIKNHIAFCSEDRKSEGIIPYMSVKENITISILPKISKWGIVNKKQQDEIVDKFIKALKIKVSSPNQTIRSLSGGNQQKVLLARWLCANPELLILDEPTRGIDVGAKKEILDLAEGLAKDGISVLVVSSELEELVQLCDRVQVIKDGSTVGQLKNNEITVDAIMNNIAHGLN
ncbi:sugar ABC transporter ATP-binding protein [Clostridium sp. DL1XJH146]